MGRRGYPAEFRRRVVELVESGRSVKELAQDLGVSEQTIYTWRRQARIDAAFGIDVLECPRCGGKLVLLACITQPRVIRAILRSLGLPDAVPAMAPARAPPDEEPTFDIGA